MNISRLVKVSQQFAIDNSPSLLTAIGVVGVFSTAVLTGKASYRAAEVISENWTFKPGTYDEEPTPRQKVELTWKLFIPAGVTGSLTVAAILGANHISASRAAGLAAAYSLSERAFEEYAAKVAERIGPKKEQAVRDEIAQDRVNKTPSTELIIMGTDVPCFDSYSGRYFSSSMEKIRKAENDLNYMLLHEGAASLTDFYDMLGLTPTQHSTEVGWSSDLQLEVYVSTVIAEDNRPCLAINFRTPPAPRYNRHF